MKKIFRFISIAINSLIGIPCVIGLYELLNFTISIMIGQYVRIDEGILDVIIQNYYYCSMLGYGFAFIMFFCKQINVDNEKDIIEKVKYIIIISWIVFVFIFFLLGIRKFFLPTVCISTTFGLSLFFVYMLDKFAINQINDKIESDKK